MEYGRASISALGSAVQRAAHVTADTPPWVCGDGCELQNQLFNNHPWYPRNREWTEGAYYVRQRIVDRRFRRALETRWLGCRTLVTRSHRGEGFGVFLCVRTGKSRADV